MHSYREAPGAPIADASADELALRAAPRARGGGRCARRCPTCPYGAFLSGGVDSAAIVAAMRAGGRAGAAARSPSASRASATSSTRARAAAAVPRGARHATITWRSWEEVDFPRALAARCTAARGALREPVGAGAAPAEPLRGPVRQGRALRTGRGRAARRLPRGPGRRRARAARARPGARADGPWRAWPACCRATSAPSARRGVLGAAARPGPAAAASSRSPRRPCARGAPGAPATRRAVERRELAEQTLTDVADRGAARPGAVLDTHLFLPDHLLLYGDKMSMAHGLEHRVPFLDVELMRFVERIPANVARCAAGRASGCTGGACATLVPRAGAVHARSARSRRPTTSGCATSLAGELARSFAPGSPVSRARRRPHRPRGSSTSTGAGARTTSASCTACSSSRSGTVNSSRSSRRKHPAARHERPSAGGIRGVDAGPVESAGHRGSWELADRGRRPSKIEDRDRARRDCQRCRRGYPRQPLTSPVPRDELREVISGGDG